MTDQMDTSGDRADLAAIIGPNEYIEIHAQSFDKFIPGLGEALRQGWQAVAPAAFIGLLSALSGADNELEFYA